MKTYYVTRERLYMHILELRHPVSDCVEVKMYIKKSWKVKM